MLLKELLPSLKIKLYAFDRVKLGNWWNYKKINSPVTRLFYITNGKAKVSFNGETYHLEKDHLIIIPPFVPVDYYCEDQCDNYYMLFTAQLSTGIELFSLPGFKWIHIADKITKSYYKRMLELNPNMGLKIVDPADKTYNAKLFADKDNSFTSSRSILEIDGIIRIILSSFLDINIDINPKSDQSIERLVKVLAYIDNNLDKPITLRDMANVISLHPNYFSDFFMQQMGERPIAYITDKRIKKAQFMLTTTNYLIKQIALEIGFQDIDYFYRVFKKKIGISPGKYRKQIFNQEPRPSGRG